jgi:hypothetical protein
MQKEVAHIMECWGRDLQSKAAMDLESTEMQVRGSMHQTVARLLEQLIAAEGTGYQGSKIDCGGTHHYRYIGDREKELRKFCKSGSSAHDGESGGLLFRLGKGSPIWRSCREYRWTARASRGGRRSWERR